MMNKRLRQFSYFLCCLCGLAGPVWAGSNPLVAVPQGNYFCEVEVKTHGGAGPEAAVGPDRSAAILKKISITRSGKMRRDVMTWADGSSNELWILPEKNVALLEGRDPGKTVMVLRGDYREGVTPRLLDLTEESFNWISQETGQEAAGEGENLLHYKAEVTLRPAEGDVPAVTATYQAWLDPKTRVPVKLDDGSALYLLKFSPGREENLMLPPKFKEELDLWLATLFPARHR